MWSAASCHAEESCKGDEQWRQVKSSQKDTKVSGINEDDAGAV